MNVSENEEKLGLGWNFNFEDEIKLKEIQRKTHCVLIYADEEGCENQWELKEGATIYLGRSNGIGANDKRLSRQQVECNVDFDRMKVFVKQIGRHASLNQMFRKIGHGCTAKLGHLDTFWLLDEKYPIYVFLETHGQALGAQDEDEDEEEMKGSESDESGICSLSGDSSHSD